MYFKKYTQKIEFYSTLLYSIMEGTYYTYFRIFVKIFGLCVYCTKFLVLGFIIELYLSKRNFRVNEIGSDEDNVLWQNVKVLHKFL